MNERTRLLLRELSTDVTNSVVGRLKDGPASVGDLVDLGIARAQVVRALELLLAYDLVSYEVDRDRREQGRPGRIWRLSSVRKKDLERLERAVSAL